MNSSSPDAAGSGEPQPRHGEPQPRQSWSSPSSASHAANAEPASVPPAPRRGPVEPHRGGFRRWGLGVALAVAILGAAGAGAWAADTYRTGSQWQERAIAETQRADAAEARVAELLSERDDLADRLERSEADVADLEGRLAELAGEKAGAEDTAALAAEVAEDLAGLSQRGAEVGAALRACVADTVALTNDVLAAAPGALDPVATNARIDEINSGCAAAEDDYARLLEDLDAVGR